MKIDTNYKITFKERTDHMSDGCWLITVIKAIRKITGKTLKEAKDIYQLNPHSFNVVVRKDANEKIQMEFDKLVECGFEIVSIEPIAQLLNDSINSAERGCINQLLETAVEIAIQRKKYFRARQILNVILSND